MKRGKNKKWLFEGVASRVALAPALGTDAWLQEVLAAQDVYQQAQGRDFNADGAESTAAREAMTAFTQGAMPAPEEVAKVLESMMDPDRDPLGMEVKGDAAGIEDPQGLSEVFVELGGYDRTLFNLGVTGHFIEAAQHVPAEGYSSPCGTDVWTLGDVLNVLDHLARYWILDELNQEARNCRARIYEPTGWALLDGEFTGAAPLVSGLIGPMERQLALVEKVAELHAQTLRTGERDPNVAEDANLLVFRTQRSRCEIRMPRVTSSRYGRPAGVEETAFLRDLGLEAIAQREYVRLRQEHGDQLETYIEARMTFARRKVAQLRAELELIRSERRRWMRKGYTRLGITPHARLWLACEATVAWALPVRPEDKSPLTLAVEGFRSGSRPRRPKPHRRNVRAVRDLFYALRCTVVKDPDYLPESLRTGNLPGGQAVTAGTYSNVVQLGDCPIPFAVIWAEREAHDTHKGKEARSTRFSGEANRFIKAHDAECAHCRGKAPCPVVDGRWKVTERWLR